LITKITGKLVSLQENEAALEVGAFEYEVYVPEFVRRQMQALMGQTVSLKTIEYLEGNPQQGRMTPRLVGFMNDAEREFFELICSVDGVGVKKALRAMVRPVREVATAIEEQDIEQLTALPGFGAAIAERVVAKLRRKMARFALLVAKELPPEDTTDRSVLDDTYEALIALGHTPSDAREKIETATEGKKKKFKSSEELIRQIYQNERR
jgi:Holliday junction DNA helicase RuvA